MDPISLVAEKLKSENTDFSPGDWQITISPGSSDEYTIHHADIAYADNRLAWFQTDNDYRHLLRVFENGESFDWEPITYNPVFGCDCLLLKWYPGHLIFIYIEKHEIYICCVKNKEVKTSSFHGDQISKRGDTIYYKNFGPDNGFIERFDLAGFTRMEPITSSQATLEKIYPVSIDPITRLQDQ